MTSDGSEETWKSLAMNRELARDALRILEAMAPCQEDLEDVESARKALRAAIQGLSESIGPGMP
jgi:hypothetical protein